MEKGLSVAVETYFTIRSHRGCLISVLGVNTFEDGCIIIVIIMIIK